MATKKSEWSADLKITRILEVENDNHEVDVEISLEGSDRPGGYIHAAMKITGDAKHARRFLEQLRANQVQSYLSIRLTNSQTKLEVDD